MLTKMAMEVSSKRTGPYGVDGLGRIGHASSRRQDKAAVVYGA